jgi:hypothetical protein
MIVTGYRPFGDSVEYEIVEKYENKAREILNIYGHAEAREKLEKLINKFLKEV